MNRNNVLMLCAVTSLLLAGCATPQSADNIDLARIAKNYIGVASVDELTISHVQKLPIADGLLLTGQTHYRYFVDTARHKKYICDVVLAGVGVDGTLIGNNEVHCDNR